jgi:hypothetical protein
VRFGRNAIVGGSASRIVLASGGCCGYSGAEAASARPARNRFTFRIVYDFGFAAYWDGIGLSGRSTSHTIEATCQPVSSRTSWIELMPLTKGLASEGSRRAS